MMTKTHTTNEDCFFSSVVDPTNRNDVRNHIAEVVLFYLNHIEKQAASKNVIVQKDYQELLSFVTFGNYGLSAN